MLSAHLWTTPTHPANPSTKAAPLCACSSCPSFQHLRMCHPPAAFYLPVVVGPATPVSMPEPEGGPGGGEGVGVGLGDGDAFVVEVVVVLAAVGVGLGVAAGGLPIMVAVPATATHLSSSLDALISRWT